MSNDVSSPSANPPPAITQAPLDHATDTSGKMWFGEMRGWIMIVAVQVAAATYASGLNPPGGFWQDDLNNHVAGSSILHDRNQHRYTTFFYANATAFMASLVIIILLMNERFYCDKTKVAMLYFSMVLDLVGLMIAYAAGCTRRLSSSFYVIALAVVALVFVVYSAQVLPHICKAVKKCAPGMENVVGRGLMSNSERETEQA